MNARCLFSALADCQPFNNDMFFSELCMITLQVFQEEVPRAKARQQLREAQNSDASAGLSGGELWWGKMQGPKPLKCSIRGERIPMHCNV